MPKKKQTIYLIHKVDKVFFLRAVCIMPCVGVKKCNAAQFDLLKNQTEFVQGEKCYFIIVFSLCLG